MKKILFLSRSLSSGGSERRMVNLARLLKEKGYDVCFICLRDTDFYKPMLIEMNIPIMIVKGNILNPFAIIKSIRSIKPDAVISFLETPNIINCYASVLRHSWITITGESSSFNELYKELSLVHKIRGHFMGYLMRYCNYLICNSEHAKDLWIRSYPRYKKKIKTIYNPVIIKTLISTYIPLLDNKCHIVVAASYQYLKNPLGLIRAVSKMKFREHLVIDWYGAKLAAYMESEKLVSDLNLGDIIRLHGPSKDIHNIMNSADVIALFSKVEGLPNAICEGMMIGKPIIMTRVSDYKQLVTEQNGFTCDWNDEDSIANVLDKVVSLNEQELKRMGEKSKEVAKQLFNLDTIVGKWIDVVDTSLE